jgi:hypothetical protein
MTTRRTQAISIGVAALVACSAAAHGQSSTPTLAAEVAQYATDRLTAELQLTPDQVGKVQKINLATANTLRQLLLCAPARSS